jgi:hypothetical protein
MLGWLMNIEQFVEWKLAEETEVLEENTPQCQSVDHKSRFTWPGIEDVSPQLTEHD